MTKIIIYALLFIDVLGIWPFLVVMFVGGLLEALEILPENSRLTAIVWLLLLPIGVVLNYIYLYAVIGALL